MTSKERFQRTFEHKEADRVTMWDFPWEGTMNRWRREGMPANVTYDDYFDVDRVSRIIVDNSPRYPIEKISEDDTTVISKTEWGGIRRDFKDHDSVPDYLEFEIKDWDTWNEAKARITPSPDRVPWDYLAANYKRWRNEGHWILGDTYFAFNQITAYVMDMERFMIFMAEDPELCTDMLEHILKGRNPAENFCLRR